MALQLFHVRIASTVGNLGPLGSMQKYVVFWKWSTKLSKRRFDGRKLPHACAKKPILMSKMASDTRSLMKTAEKEKTGNFNFHIFSFSAVSIKNRA